MDRPLVGLASVGLLGIVIAACEMPHGAPLATTQIVPDAGAARGIGSPPATLQGIERDAGARDASAADGHGGVGDGGADSGGPPDPATLWTTGALPPFDAATVAHVRQILTRGSASGKLQTSIAKIGDSITAAREFLVDAGSFGCTFGDYEPLGGLTIAASATIFPDGSNSFTRQSQAAIGAWTTSMALGSGAIAPELAYTRAATAVLMLGTNDVGITDPAAFGADLARVVDAIEGDDVLVVLSTIPPRTDSAVAAPRVDAFNAQIRSLASTRHLPLVDLNVALSPLPSQGIGQDGVHPSVEMTGGTPSSCDLTSNGLAYGYNVRNLLTLQVLDRVWRLYP